MRSAIALAFALLTLPACGCQSKDGGGNGTGPDPVTGDPKKCDEARPGVEALYRAEPDATPVKPGDDPEAAKQLVEQLVGDNTDMVMKDCKANPARVAPCVRAATSVRQLERDCLAPLDEEGSEGNVFVPSSSHAAERP